MKQKNNPTKKSKSKQQYLLYILFVVFLMLVIFLIYTYAFLKPSNNRNWEFGFATLPKITKQGSMVTVTDMRDYRYAQEKNISAGYINRTVDVAKLQRAWFVVEPFIIKPFYNFHGIAHTYFVFDFEGQDPIAVSVEARREKGEIYSAEHGLFNQYELMYIWSTEKDITVRRVIVEHNKLYMYPLTISPQGAQQLFLQMAQTTHELETHPRFYNSLVSNCTNELAKNANKIKPNAIPFTIALFLPGYATQDLYNLGFIPHDKPLADIQNKYYISDYVSKLYDKDDFSSQLRQNILK